MYIGQYVVLVINFNLPVYNADFVHVLHMYLHYIICVFYMVFDDMKIVSILYQGKLYVFKLGLVSNGQNVDLQLK